MEAAIRPATPEDLEATFAIKREAFGPYVELVYGWDEQDQWRRHQEEFSPEHVRIVTYNGEDVGYLRVQRRADALYLSQIFILPVRQSLGIGRACMRLLEEEARGGGVPIKLQVFKVNGRAQAFYRALGFRAIGETATHIQFERSWNIDQP